MRFIFVVVIMMDIKGMNNMFLLYVIAIIVCGNIPLWIGLQRVSFDYMLS